MRPVYFLDRRTHFYWLERFLRVSGRDTGQPHSWKNTKTDPGIRNAKVVVLMVVIPEMKRLARVFDGIEMNVRHIAGQAPHARQIFQHILPLCLGDAPEGGPQGQIAVSLRREVD